MSAANDILEISLTNTPLDDPDKMAAAAELWRAIGLATSSWSRLETHVDMVLIHLNQPKHSLDIYNPDHPIGFGRKLGELRRWFNQHPALQSQAEAFRILRPKIKALSKERNKFLHSVLQSYDPQTKQAIWRGIKPEGEETFRVGKHVGSIDQLLRFAAEAHSAHVEFARILRTLYAGGLLEQLKKPVPRTLRLTLQFRRLCGRLGF